MKGFLEDVRGKSKKAVNWQCAEFSYNSPLPLAIINCVGGSIEVLAKWEINYKFVVILYEGKSLLCSPTLSANPGLIVRG